MFYFQFGYGVTYTVVAESVEEAKSKIFSYVVEAQKQTKFMPDITEEQKHSLIAEYIKEEVRDLQHFFKHAEVREFALGEVFQGYFG